MKYTKERLEPLVRKNISFAGIIRDLGLRQSGGLNGHLKRRIARFNLDTSHFKGQGSNFGSRHIGGNCKKSPSEILTLRKETEIRVHGRMLRRALIEGGREYTCERCGQLPEWFGKSLLLTPDHKNGKFWDNRPENLEFLCPNCHSQTSTFSGRNKLAAMAELEDAAGLDPAS